MFSFSKFDFSSFKFVFKLFILKYIGALSKKIFITLSKSFPNVILSFFSYKDLGFEMPNTNPIIDNVSTFDFIQRRARDKSLIKIHSLASLTKNVEGNEITEFGLLKLI